ncbi:MAG: hypothetical protein ACRC2R_03395 [Xenococcaceae cyanobacterium]
MPRSQDEKIQSAIAPSISLLKKSKRNRTTFIQLISVTIAIDNYFLITRDRYE